LRRSFFRLQFDELGDEFSDRYRRGALRIEERIEVIAAEVSV
jgi:hypothetical protein